MAFIGCTKKECPQEEAPTATLTINVKSDVSTKASFTDVQDYEKKVSKAIVLVYDSAGKLVTESTLSGNSTSMNVQTGPKTVVAVVNYSLSESSKQSLSSLRSEVIGLSDNSLNSGFVMFGSKGCTVSSSGTNNVTVTVSRLASRVALRSVTNGLASSLGALEVKCVYLSNVVADMCLGGDEPSSPEWINKEGRKDTSPRYSDYKINGTSYTASQPDMTFKSINSSVANGSSHTPSIPYLMYCYQNYSDTEPNGFSSTFSPQRTVLVVYAGYGGNYWWYPVVLNRGTIDPNTAYTVDLTITGPGSDDPNKPISKGSINATINISQWNPGSEYDETI